MRLRRDRPGAANAGRKVMALIYAMLLGADWIDDCEVLRAGRTRRLLGGWVPAPSTLGTFLRAFTFGHVRQLDRVLGETLRRAWRAGAGPGAGRLVVDVDSFIGEAHGYKKQGVGFGYTKQRGYHPIMASRADSGEVLHVRLRKGKANKPRCGPVRRRAARPRSPRRREWGEAAAGRLGVLEQDADEAPGEGRLALLDQHPCADRRGRAIADIPESDWQTLNDYPEDGEAQIAETELAGKRMIIRRTRARWALARIEQELQRLRRSLARVSGHPFRARMPLEASRLALAWYVRHGCEIS